MKRCHTCVAKLALNQAADTRAEPRRSVALVPRRRFEYAVMGEILSTLVSRRRFV